MLGGDPVVETDRQFVGAAGLLQKSAFVDLHVF